MRTATDSSGTPFLIFFCISVHILYLREKNDNMDDKIKFVKINEQDATGRSFTAVSVFINGKELTDIIKNAEQQNDKKILSNYIHLTPSELYEGLSSAMMPGSETAENGAEILCCACGCPECWSPVAHVTVDECYVYWTQITHNQMDFDYKLSYRFNKTEYLYELEKLKHFI